MKKLNVTVQCMAVYNSSIEVPDDMTLEEAIEYANRHLDEIPLGELEYVSDSDELDEDNCDFDIEISEEMIKNGFKNHIISINRDSYGCIGICCKIGDNAFYFVGVQDDDLSIEEYWKSYTLDMTINMLYQILKNKDAADENGIDEGEWEYYYSMLV